MTPIAKRQTKPIHLQVKEPFERWLSLPSYDVVEVVASTVLANRLPGEPLWLALVGPSSSGKTEVVTRRLIPWVLGLDPNSKNALVSYSATKAEKLS